MDNQDNSWEFQHNANKARLAKRKEADNGGMDVQNNGEMPRESYMNFFHPAATNVGALYNIHMPNNTRDLSRAVNFNHHNESRILDQRGWNGNGIQAGPMMETPQPQPQHQPQPQLQPQHQHQPHNQPECTNNDQQQTPGYITMQSTGYIPINIQPQTQSRPQFPGSITTTQLPGYISMQSPGYLSVNDVVIQPIKEPTTITKIQPTKEKEKIKVMWN